MPYHIVYGLYYPSLREQDTNVRAAAANKKLAIANRLRVSWAHNTSKAHYIRDIVTVCLFCALEILLLTYITRPITRPTEVSVTVY